LNIIKDQNVDLVVMATHGLSQRRACGLLAIMRRSFKRTPRPDRNQELHPAAQSLRLKAAL
jgi:hypothetical protein